MRNITQAGKRRNEELARIMSGIGDNVGATVQALITEMQKGERPPPQNLVTQAGRIARYDYPQYLRQHTPMPKQAFETDEEHQARADATASRVEMLATIPDMMFTSWDQAGAQGPPRTEDMQMPVSQRKIPRVDRQIPGSRLGEDTTEDKSGLAASSRTDKEKKREAYRKRRK